VRALVKNAEAAADVLDDGIADHVGELSSDLGIGERTIRRRCHQMFGYGPKTFLRILRFQRFIASVQRANRRSLAALAIQCGYADPR
jgi:AraC-like DNA-binding protein